MTAEADVVQEGAQLRLDTGRALYGGAVYARGQSQSGHWLLVFRPVSLQLRRCELHCWRLQGLATCEVVKQECFVTRPLPEQPDRMLLRSAYSTVVSLRRASSGVGVEKDATSGVGSRLPLALPHLLDSEFNEGKGVTATWAE